MKDSIKHIFFDLDHTLWDFDRNSALAFERIFNKHKIEVELPQFLEVYEPINFNYWKAYREERVTKDELRHGRFRDSFKAFNIEYSNAMLETLALSYIEELPMNNFLFEGTLKLLKYLDKRYTLHIITNGFEEVQHLKLRKSSIAHFFDTVTTSEEVGVKKPNPLIFEKALEKATALPSNSIMIGDTFEADIIGAEQCGMQTIFYNYRKDKVSKNHIVVNDIVEITDYL